MWLMLIFWPSFTCEFRAGPKYNKVPTKELDKRLRPSLGYLVHTDPIGEPVHNDEILVASVAEEIRANG